MPKPNYRPELRLVEEHLKGGKSVAAVCRAYHVGEAAFRRWHKEYQAQQDTSCAAHGVS